MKAARGERIEGNAIWHHLPAHHPSGRHKDPRRRHPPRLPRPCRSPRRRRPLPRPPPQTGETADGDVQAGHHPDHHIRTALSLKAAFSLMPLSPSPSFLFLRMMTQGDIVITRADVAKHKRLDDLWLILLGQVWDFTDFVRQHPGGIAPILECAGRDGTAIYSEVHGPRLVGGTLDPSKLREAAYRQKIHPRSHRQKRPIWRHRIKRPRLPRPNQKLAHHHQGNHPSTRSSALTTLRPLHQQPSPPKPGHSSHPPQQTYTPRHATHPPTHPSAFDLASSAT